MQGDLREALPSMTQYALMCAKLSSIKARHRHSLQRIYAGWSRQMRQLRVGRVERERNKALKAAGLVLLFSQTESCDRRGLRWIMCP